MSMLDFTLGSQVYLACGVTDLRRSINGLAIIVKLQFNLDPYSRAMFVFCNRSQSLIKILQWDGSGFWLFMKRLDKGSFRLDFQLTNTSRYTDAL
ncbi:MAG: IS66 family insertion sequence element accessory protein TnpB [Desulfitobacteriaceae bacterium]